MVFSGLLNYIDLISGIFRKWNICMFVGGIVEVLIGLRKEFSVVIVVMLVLCVGIGVVGVISIIIVYCKKKW